MLSLIKKSLIWIVSGAATVILTACYGPAACLEHRQLTKKLTFVNEKGTPIPGLKVTYEYQMIEYFTDDNGQVTVDMSVPACGNACLSVDDVDGIENGSYSYRWQCLSLNNEPETITMEEGELSDSVTAGLPDDEN